MDRKTFEEKRALIFELPKISSTLISPKFGHPKIINFKLMAITVRALAVSGFFY
jgi:hypothetical protein